MAIVLAFTCAIGAFGFALLGLLSAHEAHKGLDALGARVRQLEEERQSMAVRG